MQLKIRYINLVSIEMIKMNISYWLMHIIGKVDFRIRAYYIRNKFKNYIQNIIIVIFTFDKTSINYW